MYDPLSQLTHCCKRVTASGDCSGMGVAKARAGAAGMTPDAIASLEWRDLQTEKDRYKITEKHTEQGTTARRVILPSTVIQPYTYVYMNVYTLSGVHVPKTYCAGCQPCKRTLYILTDHVCKRTCSLLCPHNTPERQTYAASSLRHQATALIHSTKNFQLHIPPTFPSNRGTGMVSLSVPTPLAPSEDASTVVPP